MIDHVLTVVPVRDIDVAREWYTRLLGREPDNNPMPGLIEWQIVPGAWMQVFLDADRAGRTRSNRPAASRCCCAARTGPDDRVDRPRDQHPARPAG